MTIKKTYFLSDFHLGASYISDPVMHERRIIDFLDTLRIDAKAIYLMGDIFDFWFEFKTVVPRGFVRFLGKLAELADSGIEIHYFAGNHDMWITDYLPKEIGVIMHNDPLVCQIDGKQFFLAHGDGLGDPSQWVRFINGVFRNTLCRKLFAALPTNISLPLAKRWSSDSRLSAQDSLATKGYLGEDKEHLVQYVKKYLIQNPDSNIDYFIFGHRHLMLHLQIAPATQLIILGDWITYFSYAVFDGDKMLLETLK